MNCVICSRVSGFRRKVCYKCQKESDRIVRNSFINVKTGARLSMRERVAMEQEKEACDHSGGVINRDCKRCRAAYMRVWRERGIRVAI